MIENLWGAIFVVGIVGAFISVIIFENKEINKNG